MSPSLFLKVLLVSNILFSSLIKKKKKKEKRGKNQGNIAYLFKVDRVFFFFLFSCILNNESTYTVQLLKTKKYCMQMCEAAVFFPSVLQDFMSRAKTMEHVETYKRLQRFAEAKAEDKALLTKQREIRKKVNEPRCEKTGLREI